MQMIVILSSTESGHSLSALKDLGNDRQHKKDQNYQFLKEDKDYGETLTQIEQTNAYLR